MHKSKPRKVKIKSKDYNQSQVIARSLGGYSHREHCRAPNVAQKINKRESQIYDCNQSQLIARSLGGYSHRERCRAPIQFKRTRNSIPAQPYDQKTWLYLQQRDLASPNSALQETRVSRLRKTSCQ